MIFALHVNIKIQIPNSSLISLLILTLCSLSNNTFVSRSLNILQGFLESLDVSINGEKELFEAMDSLLTMLTNNLKRIRGILILLYWKNKIHPARTRDNRSCVILSLHSKMFTSKFQAQLALKVFSEMLVN